MSAIDDGGPAFPFDEYTKDGQQYKVHLGMTLRDWFAGQALSGYMALVDDRTYKVSSGETVEEWKAKIISHDCKLMYTMADAMIEARKEKHNAL